MRWACLIPARGNSKRLPRKNVQPVGGVPIVARTIRAAREGGVPEVYVSTEDAEIERISAEAGAIVVRRPASLCADHTPSEDVVEHWLATLPADRVPDAWLLAQCTAPLTTAAHFREAMRLLEESGADSLVSVCKDPLVYFSGRIATGTEPRDVPAGTWCPHYDRRPRTQELGRYAVENGALWGTLRRTWELWRERAGGRTVALVMGREHSIDVDDAVGLAIARQMVGE